LRGPFGLKFSKTELTTIVVRCFDELDTGEAYREGLIRHSSTVHSVCRQPSPDIDDR